MQKSCSQCQAAFAFTEEDRQMLDKIAPIVGGQTLSIPAPTLCPDCREQRRSAHINELCLHKRTCDLTGKSIISNFHPQSPYTVYEQEAWYSDKWDSATYGRDFDFTRSFFEQFAELSQVVPYPCLFTAYQYDENSAYTNYAGKNKNCYLIFDSDENQDCYYSYSINGSRNCIDCYRVRRSELCAHSIDCVQCYNCSYLQDCANCTDSMFLKDCVGCRNCLLSCNLRNKEYYVENRQVTKEEFEAARAALMSREAAAGAQDRLRELSLAAPHKYMHGQQNENVSGDYLLNSKNARYCFDGENQWDCAYAYQSFMAVRDAMDIHEIGEAERVYEAADSGYNAQGLWFSLNCLDQLSELLYCNYCMHSSSLFGCVGMNRKRYCILNKQYTKEEYEELVPRIVEHMRKTGEWGEFFPISLSLFPYNETLAQDHFPLTKEGAAALGSTWREEETRDISLRSTPLPDTIETVTDAIVKESLPCEGCGKQYRLIEQELALYRQKSLPPPTTCFTCRHRTRLAKRNPRKLWDRTCAKCEKSIQTSYAPDRPETVYCGECYLQTVY